MWLLWRRQTAAALIRPPSTPGQRMQEVRREGVGGLHQCFGVGLVASTGARLTGWRFLLGTGKLYPMACKSLTHACISATSPASQNLFSAIACACTQGPQWRSASHGTSFASTYHRRLDQASLRSNPGLSFDPCSCLLQDASVLLCMIKLSRGLSLSQGL